jgi:plasmid stabilization system protein ParE
MRISQPGVLVRLTQTKPNALFRSGSKSTEADNANGPTVAAEHEDIAFHIAVTELRPFTANRVIDELIAETERLAQYSTTAVMGTAAPEIGNGVRLFPYKRWVLLFRYESHGIDVLRIADGGQDYLLQSRRLEMVQRAVLPPRSTWTAVFLHIHGLRQDALDPGQSS